jgi:hypothetical protein
VSQRINLYVPEDLKSRMAERPDLNWSRLFAELAERVLALQPSAVKRDWLIV